MGWNSRNSCSRTRAPSRAVRSRSCRAAASPRAESYRRAEPGAGLVGGPDGEVARGASSSSTRAVLERDEPTPAVSSMSPGGGQDRLLDHRQAPGGQPVGVRVAALGEDGERPTTHARDDVLAPDGGPQPAGRSRPRPSRRPRGRRSARGG